MDKKEVEKLYKKYNLKEYGYSFSTPKDTYIIYNLIAYFENKKIKYTKITPKKCIVKVIKSQPGLDLNRYNIQDYYNENLEHTKKKMKIIDFEIF